VEAHTRVDLSIDIPEVCDERGWPKPYIFTVYDRMYGDFAAKNTVCTPYIPIYVRFWPTLVVSEVLILSERSMAYPITDF
jgi:hypothetical protein